MPTYTPTNWQQGTSPPINATNLNHIETQLAAAPYSLFFLSTPYMLFSSTTINNGATNTQTCTGGSTGVPSGAKGVWINAFYTSATSGAFIQISPHAATITNTSWYPVLGIVQVSGVIVTGSSLVAVDGSGMIDFKASNANCTGAQASIMGYVY